MKVHLIKHILNFKKPGGTSRGILYRKPSWFIMVEKADQTFIGECSVIEGLSPDDMSVYEIVLQNIVNDLNAGRSIDTEALKEFPSIRMGVETLLRELETGKEHLVFESSFTHGRGIPINGLIWMGPGADMRKQIIARINEGYRCIKMKIAALPFDEELQLLSYIRSEFSASDIQIRVDANGGFNSDNVHEKLKQLSEFELHSIEQPVKPGQWDVMAELTESEILPIALDEELIGKYDTATRRKLLAHIKPDYIVLKPSLIGGFTAGSAWIDLAEEMQVKWWITSALESNVGLNAIAQWSQTFNPEGYQGLGTGQLFTNNIPSPLFIKSGHLYYGSGLWDLSVL